MSDYYVRYTMDGRTNWAGPFVNVYEARRERDAWRASGEQAQVLHSTVEVRAQVRAWLEGRS